MSTNLRDCSKCSLGKEKKIDGKSLIYCKVDNIFLEKEKSLVFCGVVTESYEITKQGKIFLMEKNL